MRVLYFDCFSGISGDMAVGALRDLGVREEVFARAIESLGLGDEIHVHFQRQSRQSISGIKFDAHIHGHHDDGSHDHGPDGHDHGRTYRAIRSLIEGSSLPAEVGSRVLAVFHRIAVAEGKIHGVQPEDVAFHEVGAADSIADIVAFCAGIHEFGPLAVQASVPVEGTGWITCAHGRFPLPAPATLEILAGIPLRQVEDGSEFITPTGAAFLAEYCGRFGPMPAITVERIGYGLGTRDTPNRPNALRAILGQSCESVETESDEIAQIETNLDDLSPELAAAAMQRLFQAGALDVFFTPVQMKKNRPGFVMTVLCPAGETEPFVRLVLRETSAFGLRIHTLRRRKLRREFRDVATPYGSVRVKIGFLGAEQVQATPEFDSCQAVAETSGAGVREVYLAATSAAMQMKIPR